MDDDFNTPRAIALLFELASVDTAESSSSLLAIGKVLGLFSSGKEAFFGNSKHSKQRKVD